MTISEIFFNTFLYIRRPKLTFKYIKNFRRLPNYWRPRLYSEKLQWRKLFDRNKFFPTFLDKLQVGQYVANRAPTLRLPRILWQGEDASQIPYDKLPEQYVIKPNHRSGRNYFVRSKNDVKPGYISENSKEWLRRPEGKYDGQWGYQTIKGQVFVEEMLETDQDHDHSRDYRFHVFNGRVEFIVVEFGAVADGKRRVLHVDSFYDRDWNLLPYRRIRDDETSEARPVPRPGRLTDMIAAAEALCVGVDYLRIDLFLINGGIWFGEITVYPGSGYNRYCVAPGVTADDLDTKLGEIWTLPKISGIDLITRSLLG